LGKIINFFVKLFILGFLAMNFWTRNAGNPIKGTRLEF